MEATKNPGQLVKLAFKAIGLATAVAAIVLNAIGMADLTTMITLQGISLVCLAIAIF